MSKRRNLKKEKQERNRAYARKFKKRKLRNDGREKVQVMVLPELQIMVELLINKSIFKSKNIFFNHLI